MHHFQFGHGLGDAVQFAHALELWRRRGHRIAVDCSPDKAALFRAAGCEIVPGATLVHEYAHAPGPGEPDMHDSWSGNKVAWNLVDGPTPRIGSYSELWDELVAVTLTLPDPPESARREIDRFVDEINPPLILLHTRGNTWQDAKNFEADLEVELYAELLDRTSATLLLLDWDERVCRPPHHRIRHVTDDFRRLDVLETAYLIRRAQLYIGVDSGPLHLTRFTGTPALGVWFQLHPAHYALPRALTAHVVDDRYGVWNSRRRHSYNLIDTPHITAAFIAEQARRALAGQTGRSLAVANAIDRLRTSTHHQIHDRHRTFGLLVERLKRQREPRIVETGCCRVWDRDDWTAGASTYILGLLLDQIGGHLDSVDIDPDHVAVARAWVAPFGGRVTVHQSDSRAWFRRYGGPKLDAVYLDSADVGTERYQEICLEEAEAAIPHLKPDGLLLIDDSFRQAGRWHGKGGLAIPHLLDRGWRLVASGWQTLLARA